MRCFLAIETATWGGSVALLTPEGCVDQYLIESPRQQTQTILPLIDNLLNQYGCSLTDLDCLAVSIGPGSFTGLRVGVSVAQAIAWAQDIPIVAISTLSIIAQTAYRLYGQQSFWVGLNAYMQEFYLGRYQYDLDSGCVRAQNDDILLKPQQLKQISIPNKQTLFVGDAWDVYKDQWPRTYQHLTEQSVSLRPQALDLLSLARYDFKMRGTMTVEDLQPAYLRGSSAWQKAT